MFRKCARVNIYNHNCYTLYYVFDIFCTTVLRACHTRCFDIISKYTFFTEITPLNDENAESGISTMVTEFVILPHNIICAQVHNKYYYSRYLFLFFYTHTIKFIIIILNIHVNIFALVGWREVISEPNAVNRVISRTFSFIRFYFIVTRDDDLKT